MPCAAWTGPDLHVCPAATVNGTDNATNAQPNAALYQQADTFHGNSDRLLRVLTLHGEPCFPLCAWCNANNATSGIWCQRR